VQLGAVCTCSDVVRLTARQRVQWCGAHPIIHHSQQPPPRAVTVMSVATWRARARSTVTTRVSSN